MAGQYNLRNPAVKRLMKEAQELREPTEQYFAQPLEDNLFEWHFTIRGPDDSDFDTGIYHGRIVLPPEYPMKPPSIMLLTPNGRFETYKKICLSISGHHPESWQPSWSIRTALLAIIGFMPTHGNGAIGSLDYTPVERKVLAKKSLDWKCPECGSVRTILKPVTEASKATNQEAKELASQINFQGEKDKENGKPKETQGVASAASRPPAAASAPSTSQPGLPLPGTAASPAAPSMPHFPQMNPQLFGGRFPMMPPGMMPPGMMPPGMPLPGMANGAQGTTQPLPPFWPGALPPRTTCPNPAGPPPAGGMWPQFFNPMMMNPQMMMMMMMARAAGGTSPAAPPGGPAGTPLAPAITVTPATPTVSSAPATSRLASSAVPPSTSSSSAGSAGGTQSTGGETRESSLTEPPATHPPPPSGGASTPTPPTTPSPTASPPPPAVTPATTGVRQRTVPATPVTSTTRTAPAPTPASFGSAEIPAPRTPPRENPVVVIFMALLGLAIIVLLLRRLYNIWEAGLFSSEF